MAEYIELEVVVKAFNNFDAGRADSPPFTLLTPEEFAECLYELPAADVAPVVHGRWASVPGKRERICSRCQCDEPYKFADENAEVFEFCPHCGATMDGAE